MKTSLYRKSDGNVVPARVLCGTGEATLLFVPSNGEGHPDSLIIAHDDDLDGVFEDTEMNWFNVERKDMMEIVTNLQSVAEPLRPGNPGEEST